MNIDTVMLGLIRSGKQVNWSNFSPPLLLLCWDLFSCSVGWCLFVVGSCCLGKSAQLATFARSLFERSERGNWGGVGLERGTFLFSLGSIQSPDALRSMSNNYWFGCSTPEFLSGFALARVVPRSSAPTTPPRIAFFPRRRATDQRLGMVGSGKETYDSLALARRGGMFLSRP